MLWMCLNHSIDISLVIIYFLIPILSTFWLIWPLNIYLDYLESCSRNTMIQAIIQLVLKYMDQLIWFLSLKTSSTSMDSVTNIMVLPLSVMILSYMDLMRWVINIEVGLEMYLMMRFTCKWSNQWIVDIWMIHHPFWLVVVRVSYFRIRISECIHWYVMRMVDKSSV